jgi:hypothetical protein
MRRPITVCAALVLVMVALMVAGHDDGPALAGTAAPPDVAGKWEGSWIHQWASGQITLQLTQEGTRVTGKNTVTGLMPVIDMGSATPQALGPEVRDGILEGRTLIFHVAARGGPSEQVNFTLTVDPEEMTGTACGFTCATVKLKKASF